MELEALSRRVAGLVNSASVLAKCDVDQYLLPL